MVVAVLLLSGGSSLRAQQPGAKLWSFEADSLIQSSPAIGPDGTLYTGSDSGMLYAINPDGSKKWEFKTGNSIAASPAVGADGTIYVPSTDRVLYALNPDGSLKWLVSPGTAMVASPAIAADGTLYAAAIFNTLYAFTPGGSKKWEFTTMGNLVSSPAIGSDGTIYVGDRTNLFYAIGPEGSRRWVFELGDGVNASPAIGPDGMIYVGALDGVVYALTVEGTLKWKYPTGGPIRSSPAVGKDGAIYVGSDDNNLYAFNPDGTVRWTYATDNWVRSSPAIDANGTVYVGSYDHALHAVHSDGSLKWRFATAWHVSASPVIGTNGTVYVGSWDKQLYALKAGAILADSPWPMFRRDARHTARTGTDTANVTVTLLGPERGESLISPARISLIAMVDGERERVVKLEFFEGIKSIGESSARPFTIQWQGVGPGTYVVTARATLQSGATHESNPVNLTVEPAQKNDRVQPVVTIVAPEPNGILRETSAVVRGTASDNVGIARVEYQIGTGPIQTAVGTTNWFALFEPQPGPNRFWVKSVDTSGNQSLVISRNFSHRGRLLTVRTNGPGKITPVIPDDALQTNKTYTLTAEPDKDHIFAGWSGSVDSKDPRLVFTLETNLLLQANFVPNPFATAHGDYYGLITPPDPEAFDWTGTFTATLNHSGQLKGKLQFGRANEAFSIQLDQNGYGQQAVRHAGAPGMLEIKLDLLHEANVISGKLGGSETTAALVGDREESGDASKFAGKYTMILPPPDGLEKEIGDGFVAITVSDKGVVSLRGQLADGAEVRAESRVNSSGVWPVHVVLYGGRGGLTGWARFSSQPHGDIHAKLTWIKPAQTGDRFLAQGTLSEVHVVGSAYVPPAEGEPLLKLAGNLLTGFQGGNLAGSVTGRLNILGNNKGVFATNLNKLSIRLSPETGLFSGTFVHPALGKETTFQGAVLQKQNWCGGHFFGTNQTGAVYIGSEAQAATP